MKTKWIHNEKFTVTDEMVLNGAMMVMQIPKIVLGSFDCVRFKLTTLKNCPKEVFGDFDCDGNLLTNLKHCPKKINGYFSCEYNRLTSLEFGPEYVDVRFYCNNNSLTSLEFGPKFIGGFIYTDDHLKIERKLLLKGYTDYYPDLLKHCIEENIDVEEINHWPDGFLTDGVIKSSKGISKFDL